MIDIPILFRFAFLEVNLLDVFDILVVAFVLYNILLVIRGTRALSMVLGLMFIMLVAFVSTWLKMESLNWILSKIAAVWLIAFIIVFQPELRNILTNLGNNRFFRRIVPSDPVRNIDIMLRAIEVLKNARTGALIVIKRDVGIKQIEETGKPINAALSPELLVTLFAPHTPLHDGAVIIENEHILVAAAQLPMTQNPRYQMDIGMRHRAAVGISEETDAVALVVSEESGQVSMALRGHLRRDLTLPTLRKLLEVILRRK